MPSRYTPDQKQEALRLLFKYDHNIPIVEQLTGVPRSTLYRWRKQQLSQDGAQMRQKNIPSSDNHSHETETPLPADRKAGISGRTYPYPLEDDEADADENLDDFRRLRSVLMQHAQNLAADLNPDDPDINRRSLALSRILDRIHQLDAMLPDLLPEQILRHEFVYDGMVHDKPPWERTEDDLLEQLEFVRREKAREARNRAIEPVEPDFGPTVEDIIIPKPTNG